MEVITIWRVEKRLVKNAVSGTIIAIISWKIEVSHWPVVTLIPNSWTIVGNAAVSCNCAKLPINVINVRIAREIKAGRVRRLLLYASSPVNAWLRSWLLLDSHVECVKIKHPFLFLNIVFLKRIFKHRWQKSIDLSLFSYLLQQKLQNLIYAKQKLFKNLFCAKQWYLDWF